MGHDAFGVTWDRNIDKDIAAPSHALPGDSFVGALAVALSQGKDIEEAVAFGNTVGSLTVMRAGAQTSLPWLHEVDLG